MGAVVSLLEVVAAMDLPNEEWESLLDPESGEIVTITEEDRRALESPEPRLLPDWEQDVLLKVRQAIESGRYLRLPDSFEIHEWSIMERFCGTVDAPEARRQLLDAIHGSGAFRFFRHTLDRLGLWEQWLSYRDSTLQQIARDWLEAHGIPYK